MDITADLKEYRRELNLDSNGVENRGSTWYATYFRKNENESILQGQQSIENPKADDFIPRFIVKNLTSKYLLGYGRYSLVWMTELGDSKRVALKQFDLKKVRSDEIFKERDFMIYLKNKRICNIIGAFFDQDAFIAMELCYGSLRSLLPEVRQRNAVRFAIQLAEALQWCHDKSIIHCDFKPDNVLVTTLNNVVLSDFGQAIFVPQGVSVVKAKVSLGDAQYQDYESNTDFTYSFASDMFSFGCVFYELLTHQRLKEPIDGGVLKSTGLSPTNFYGETLEDCVVNTAGEFKTAIFSLTDQRPNRWSASRFLKSAIMKDISQKFGVSQNSLDNDTTDMVTMEQRQIKDTKFAMHSDDINDSVIAVFHGLYYDEKDAYGENVSQKPFLFNEANLAGSCAKPTNSVPKLFDALAKNDPFANPQPRGSGKKPADFLVVDLAFSDLDNSDKQETNYKDASNSFADTKGQAENFENKTKRESCPFLRKTTLTKDDMLSFNEENITLPRTSRVVIEPNKGKPCKPTESSKIREQNKMGPYLGCDTIKHKTGRTKTSSQANSKRKITAKQPTSEKIVENEQMKSRGRQNYNQVEFSVSDSDQHVSGTIDENPPNQFMLTSNVNSNVSRRTYGHGFLSYGFIDRKCYRKGTGSSSGKKESV